MRLAVFFQKAIPHHCITKIFGFLANCRWPFLKNALIKKYMKVYNIDLSIAEESNYKNYKTFNDFFIRPLKTECRPINADDNAIVSPVDGTLYQIGKINENPMCHAKGFEFSLSSLLAHKDIYSNSFIGGDFLCMYLSPQDYHRVHMPFTGKLLKSSYIPGKLFSVNPELLNEIPEVFALNERLICLFETKLGPMVIILIGAMNVASIHTVWAGAINSEHSKRIVDTDYTHETIILEKGKELGHFQMGSTIICLFLKNKINWASSTAINTHKKYGEILARVL